MRRCAVQVFLVAAATLGSTAFSIGIEDLNARTVEACRTLGFDAGALVDRQMIMQAFREMSRAAHPDVQHSLPVTDSDRDRVRHPPQCDVNAAKAELLHVAELAEVVDCTPGSIRNFLYSSSFGADDEAASSTDVGALPQIAASSSNGIAESAADDDDDDDDDDDASQSAESTDVMPDTLSSSVFVVPSNTIAAGSASKDPNETTAPADLQPGDPWVHSKVAIVLAVLVLVALLTSPDTNGMFHNPKRRRWH